MPTHVHDINKSNPKHTDKHPHANKNIKHTHIRQKHRTLT